MTNNKTIAVDYSDAKLCILVEEYITMQRSEFTFKGVCSFVLYRAMEEERTKGRKDERTKERKNERTKERKNERTKEPVMYESYQIASDDYARVRLILETIIRVHRIVAVANNK